MTIERNVPFFRRLSANDQAELLGHIRVLLAEKRFEGCGGLALTDEIRVTIAAQACLLSFFGRVTVPAHKREDWPPVDSAKLGQRLPRVLEFLMQCGHVCVAERGKSMQTADESVSAPPMRSITSGVMRLNDRSGSSLSWKKVALPSTLNTKFLRPFGVSAWARG